MYSLPCYSVTLNINGFLSYMLLIIAFIYISASSDKSDTVEYFVPMHTPTVIVLSRLISFIPIHQHVFSILQTISELLFYKQYSLN